MREREGRSRGVQLKGVKLVAPLDVAAETGDVAR